VDSNICIAASTQLQCLPELKYIYIYIYIYMGFRSNPEILSAVQNFQMCRDPNRETCAGSGLFSSQNRLHMLKKSLE
jgi:hypothetical protein